MFIRRLVKAGQTSHTISLPKEWITKNNLKKGDTVYIHPKTDTELRISATTTKQTPEKKEITININDKETNTIQREITAAYLNNYSTITLIGETITQKTKEIRKILHDFVALEISEQTNKRIIAKDLLNIKEISLSQTTKRMDMIIRTMITDTIKTYEGEKLQQSIKFRDYDINRLYFLGARLLKGALTNNQLAEQIKINKNQILEQWNLITNLENLADYVKNLNQTSQKDKNTRQILKQIQQNYLTIIKAMHQNDKQTADQIIQQRKQTYKQCQNIKNKETSSKIKAITTSINNIAKIIIDKE